MGSQPVIPGLTFQALPSGKAPASRSSLPSPGQTLLITDDLASPGEFLLYSYVISHFKSDGNPPSGQGKRRAAFVTSKSEAHCRTISSKLGLNLNQYITSGALEILHPQLEDLHSIEPQSESPLQAIFGGISQFLSSVPQERDDTGHALTMIVLDDIASLEWIGIPSKDLVRFLRALHALICKHDASLVVLNHTLRPNSPSSLFRHLAQTCDVWVQISSLSSGRSGAVSGEISIHPGHMLDDPEFQPRPKPKALHYRLSDTGSAFFDRGTGGVVL